MKRALQRLLAFLLFAILVQGLGYLSHIDILDDLTIFNHFPLALFLLAAGALSFVLDMAQLIFRNPVHKYILDVSVLVLLSSVAVLYARFAQGDGIAVGMKSFLIGYWVVLIGLFRLGMEMINRRKSMGGEQRPGR